MSKYEGVSQGDQKGKSILPPFKNKIQKAIKNMLENFDDKRQKECLRNGLIFINGYSSGLGNSVEKKKADI